MLARLQPPFNETLDHSSGGERVFLEDNNIVSDKGIGLDEDLSRLWGGFSAKIDGNVRENTNQFLLENQIPDLAFPAGGRPREFSVELLRTLPISGTFADLEFDQELSGDILALGQDFVSVELGLQVSRKAIFTRTRRDRPGYRGFQGYRHWHESPRPLQCLP